LPEAREVSRQCSAGRPQPAAVAVAIQGRALRAGHVPGHRPIRFSWEIWHLRSVAHRWRYTGRRRVATPAADPTWREVLMIPVPVAYGPIKG
jgi:hypothetical protein